MQFAASLVRCTELYRVTAPGAERRNSSGNKSNFTRFQNNLNSNPPPPNTPPQSSFLFLFKAFCNKKKKKRICCSVVCNAAGGQAEANRKVTLLSSIERDSRRAKKIHGLVISGTHNIAGRDSSHLREHVCLRQTVLLQLLCALYFNNHLLKHQSEPRL